VLAIYIRDVSDTAKRQASIETLGGHVEKAESVLLLASTTAEMAVHAARAGLIAETVVPQVAEDAAHPEPAAEETEEEEAAPSL